VITTFTTQLATETVTVPCETNAHSSVVSTITKTKYVECITSVPVLPVQTSTSTFTVTDIVVTTDVVYVPCSTNPASSVLSTVVTTKTVEYLTTSCVYNAATTFEASSGVITKAVPSEYKDVTVTIYPTVVTSTDTNGLQTTSSSYVTATIVCESGDCTTTVATETSEIVGAVSTGAEETTIVITKSVNYGLATTLVTSATTASEVCVPVQTCVVKVVDISQLDYYKSLGWGN